MPLPGEAAVETRAGAAELQAARALESACLPDAIVRYEAAIAAAEAGREPAILAESLRALAVARHHRNETAEARRLCRKSCDVARQAGEARVAAEALNTLGAIDLATGALDEARRMFLEARELGHASRALRARVEQNLGILANIQGDQLEALGHYERSLEEYRATGDEPGCAIAYHNLGMVNADRGRLEAASCYFQESYAIAERTGNTYLQGLCLVNHAEVEVAREQYDSARLKTEAALGLFARLGARAPTASAHRVLGMVHRETGRLTLAEASFKTAIALAATAGSMLNEAEASRELGLLYQRMGRNHDGLRRLNVAYGLFRRLNARVELVDVEGRIADVKRNYLELVRAWGQSMEWRNAGAFGHCERLARHGVAVARVLGLDQDQEMAVLLGAYLHDIGLLRVPQDTINKTDPLTLQEQELVQMHPIWGLELLSTVEFPWEVKPIIRWHHEHYDGSGYPDKLEGNAIPLAAQIIGILDEFDSLTTKRTELAPRSAREAIEDMHGRRAWWSEPVFQAFLRVVTAPA
ncbi:MAG TPA: HD domain-containing phosphohydrolase [Gemmatimonadales bacterium]|nr:HD domain-containing phosphohydrolase [Gemmatimonadales bacterium]